MLIGQIILDIVVISLLVITIIFCWRLNNKIIELKSSKKSLRELVKIFDTAVIKTHKSIADLKNASSSSAEELSISIERANDLLSDLSFINDTAAKLADRLEKDIEQIRKHKEFQSFVVHKRQDVDQIISGLGESEYTNENTSSSQEGFSKAKDDLMQAIRLVKNE